MTGGTQASESCAEYIQNADCACDCAQRLANDGWSVWRSVSTVVSQTKCHPSRWCAPARALDTGAADLLHDKDGDDHSAC